MEILELAEIEGWPSGKIPGFADKLLNALPGLKEHTCSYGESGGFMRRLTEGEGTWLGHVLEHVAIELQNEAGSKVTFGKTRDAGSPGVYDIVFQYEQAEVGLEAGHLAMRLLHSLLPESLRPAGVLPPDFEFLPAREEFI